MQLIKCIIMARRFLLLLFVISFCSLPNMAAPLYELGVYEQIDEPQINVTLDGSKLHINGAEGLTLEIVSLTGKRVAITKISSFSQSIELNIPKGCYILKIGKFVRKISIQ